MGVSGGLNVLIEYGYDGTDFFGSQVQSGKPTINGTFERILEDLYCTRIRFEAASRTDKGVHARCAGATIRIPGSRGPDVAKLIRVLNDKLPLSVRVNGIYVVPVEFHARFNALSREYRYRWRERVEPSALEVRYCDYQRLPLNRELVEEAVSYISGVRSFKGFTIGGDDQDNYVCNILSTQIRWRGTYGEFRIVADRFLYHMIRRLMWSIFEIGKGDITLNAFRKVLDEGKPFFKNGLADARGLILWKVCFRS